MRRALPLVLLLASCGSGIPSHPLQWALKENTAYAVTFRSRTSSEKSGEAPKKMALLNKPINSAIEAELVLRILEKLGDNDYRIELVPSALKMKGEVAGALVDIEFRDGKWIRDKIDVKGAVPDENADAFRKKLKGSVLKPSAGRARSFGLKSQSDSLLGPIFRHLPWLPPAPVRVGDRWSEPLGLLPSMRTDTPEQVRMLNVLDSVEGGPDRPVAVISTDLKTSMQPEGTEVTRSRSARFDVKGGYFTKLADDLTTTLSKDGFSLSIKVQTEMTVEPSE